MYFNSMMAGTSFSMHHHPCQPCVRMVQAGGRPIAGCNSIDAGAPSTHPLAPLSLSLAYPHLPRDCAWSPLVVVAPACSRDATQHLQTHVTTMPKSTAIPGYSTGLFTTGPTSIPRPGVFKGGGGEGCFGRDCSFGFYVLRSTVRSESGASNSEVASR